MDGQILDTKIAAIKADRLSKDFIIADAKDADMAFGVRAPGPRTYLSLRGERPARFSPEIWTRDEYGYRNLPEFLDIIREVVNQGLVDIMLMSAYVNEQFTIKEGLFRNSRSYPRRAGERHDRCLGGPPWMLHPGARPAFSECNHRPNPMRQNRMRPYRRTISRSKPWLYSVTFVNELEQDRDTLNAFKAFREEAERKKFRYFLEVFDPNISSGVRRKIGGVHQR